MIPAQRSSLASYAADLLANGRAVFSTEEAVGALGVGRGAFLDAAERLQSRGYLISPRRGFYVVVPPQYASWGAPPPSWFIDDLLRHEKRPYYVALLKAAELHGASHQAVMAFQVMTNKRLPKIRAGRASVVFYFRKDMEAVLGGVEESRTDTGTMKVSSVELTALDLVRYPNAAGGMDNLATVLAELGARLDPQKLAALSAAAERPVVQRLGHLLERLGHGACTGPMREALLRRGSPPWVELDRKLARDADFAPPPQQRDERFRVVVRRAPEVDE